MYFQYHWLIYKYFFVYESCKLNLFLFFQKLSTTVALRSLSAESTDLKKVLSEKIPKEQERIKAFRKEYGSTKVGEVTVDMV